MPDTPRTTDHPTATEPATSADIRRPTEPAQPARRQPSTGHSTISFPEPRLLVRAWPDPVLDNLGHDPRSTYVEQYWLSILGPSATLLLRRLANGLDAKPEGFELDPGRWALELGLGAKGGRHGPFWRSVDRICRFKTAQRNGETLTVRRRLPPLTARQVERLPEHLRRAHEAWARRQLAQPRRRTIARWPEHAGGGALERRAG